MAAPKKEDAVKEAFSLIRKIYTSINVSDRVEFDGHGLQMRIYFPADRFYLMSGTIGIGGGSFTEWISEKKAVVSLSDLNEIRAMPIKGAERSAAAAEDGSFSFSAKVADPPAQFGPITIRESSLDSDSKTDRIMSQREPGGYFIDPKNLERIDQIKVYVSQAGVLSGDPSSGKIIFDYPKAKLACLVRGSGITISRSKITLGMCYIYVTSESDAISLTQAFSAII
jgi:hypothetical protein